MSVRTDRTQTFSDGDLVEQTVDNGDGTGERTTYKPDGTIKTTEQLTGLYVEPPEVKVEKNIREAVEAALASNDTYLGISSPTNAMNAAQIKSLTRQMNGLIRLAVDRYDTN